MTKNLLCCDWGTSSFRLRLVDTSNYQVVAEHQSSKGVAGVFKSWQAAGSADRFNFYGEILTAAIKNLASSSALNLTDIPVIVSGMASSSIGMEEIPYADLPFAANGSQASALFFQGFNGISGELVVVSGVKSDLDVMRGEEAQLIGLFNLKEILPSIANNTLFVFPGTHSKHIVVEDESITGFKTFMTGELFNILGEHSILKDSIETNGSFDEPDNSSAFKAGVKASATSNLLNTLFTVRTNQLFSKFPKEQNAFFLSGLLIGTELSELRNTSYKQLVICSGKHLFNHYKTAAEELELKENVTFIQPELIDKATIAGQIQIFKALTNL